MGLGHFQKFVVKQEKAEIRRLVSPLKSRPQTLLSFGLERNLKILSKAFHDKKEGDFFVGRTQYDSPEVDNVVLIDASKHYVPVGSFTEISIDRAEDFDLYGHPKS